MKTQELQTLVYQEYKKNKYDLMWLHPSISSTLDPKAQNIYDLAEVGLITTEIAEALENIRENDYSDELYYEMADIVIRVLNFCSRKGVNLEYFIVSKNDKNLNRGDLHNKTV